MSLLLRLSPSQFIGQSGSFLFGSPPSYQRDVYCQQDVPVFLGTMTSGVGLGQFFFVIFLKHFREFFLSPTERLHGPFWLSVDSLFSTHVADGLAPSDLIVPFSDLGLSLSMEFGPFCAELIMFFHTCLFVPLRFSFQASFFPVVKTPSRRAFLANLLCLILRGDIFSCRPH